MPNTSQWDTTAGGLDEARIDITDAYFTVDADYQADTVILKLEVQVFEDDGEGGWAVHTDYPEGHEMILSIGKGWQTDGEVIWKETPSGQRKDGSIKNTTKLGRWIKWIKDNIGKPAIAREMGNLNPRAASTWKGCSFVLEEKEIPMRDGGSYTASTPTTFLGRNGEAATGDGGVTAAVQAAKAKVQKKKAAPKAAAPAPAPAPEPEPEPAPEPEVVEAPAEGDIRSKLTQLAKDASDHEEFLAAAMAGDYPELLTDEALLDEVVDPGQFFATANA